MKEAKRSKFGIVDKNGQEVWVSREEFMVIYKKMVIEHEKKTKK